MKCILFRERPFNFYGGVGGGGEIILKKITRTWQVARKKKTRTDHMKKKNRTQPAEAEKKGRKI